MTLHIIMLGWNQRCIQDIINKLVLCHSKYVHEQMVRFILAQTEMDAT